MRRLLFVVSFTFACGLGQDVRAQPTPAEALGLNPMQPSVDFDMPAPGEIEDCQVAAEEIAGESGLVVREPSGMLLRQFVDSNGDKKVDQWRYYKNGIEVYRDIDADFNGKADQYRWLGTAGTRWGLDRDEDSKIDTWKVISPEEVSAEVVDAIRTHDKKRFEGVLLSSQELATLGLGSQLREAIEERIRTANRQFARAVGQQKDISEKTKWIDFGGLRPGTIPSGTDGSKRDVTCLRECGSDGRDKRSAFASPNWNNSKRRRWLESNRCSCNRR